MQKRGKEHTVHPLYRVGPGTDDCVIVNVPAGPRGHFVGQERKPNDPASVLPRSRDQNQSCCGAHMSADRR